MGLFEEALHRAVTDGKTGVAELLIRKGADINARDKDQNTPLHWAALVGKTEVAELLIRMGADINAKGLTRQTPVEVAETMNHPELAALMRNLSGTARSTLANLAHKAAKDGFIIPFDVALAARLARTLSPPPAIPQEAQDEMVKGMAAFKLAHQSKDFDMATGHFKKAVLLAPWWPAPYYNWAVAMEKMRAFNLAKEQYGNYLLASPDATDVQAVKEKIAEMDILISRAEEIKKYAEKGKRYLANNDRDRSIEEAREIVRLDPDGGHYHFVLGHLLAYADKSHAKEAITELEYANRLGIKSAKLFWALGFSYERLDEYSSAIESYKKALDLANDDETRWNLYNNIGLAYEKKNNSKKALEHFKLAQKLGHPKKDYIKKKIRKHKRLLGR